MEDSAIQRFIHIRAGHCIHCSGPGHKERLQIIFCWVVFIVQQENYHPVVRLYSHVDGGGGGGSLVCACAYLLSRLVVTLRSSVTTRGCPSDTLDPTYLL